MKIIWKPQSLIEWIAIKANMAPAPTGAGLYGYLCKVILLAEKYNIFEACKDAPQTIEQIAQKTNLDPRPLRSVMNILTCDGYFKYKSGKFESTKITKKWCLKNSPDNVCNTLRYQNEVLMQNVNYMEEFLKNGKGLDVHQNYTEEQWEAYQNGMLDMAKATAKSAPKMAPKLRNPAEMLDIGGSHGLYCVEMCRKYPTLKATILDLPQAVDKARPILEKYSMGDRINYMIGNALTDDFGENKYDIILISSLMHHFTAEQNILVSKKATKALKSGGFFIIQDWLRPETSSKMEMVGTIMDLVFNITSLSGTRGVDEFKKFQHEAGLIHHKVKTFMEIPGFVQICAKKQ